MSGFFRNSSSESGKPMWLFKLPLLRKTVYRAERNSAVISFVVDLPALPVTATTADPESRRTRLASVCNAAIVSGTTTSGVPANSAWSNSEASLTSALAAPLLIASATYALPSNRSPRIATNMSPGDKRPRIDRKARYVAIAARPRDPSRQLPRRLQQASASPLQRFTRDCGFVKRQLLGADRLRLFVPFPCEQNQVARFRFPDRKMDRFLAIDDRESRRGPIGRGRNPALDFFDNPHRVLASRVVGRHHDDVAQPDGNRAHQRPLRAIAIAATSEHGDDARWASGRAVSSRFFNASSVCA